jgi:flagellar motor switch protein FliN/FliY
MPGQDDIPLPNLKNGGGDIDLGFADDQGAGGLAPRADDTSGKVAQDLEHVFDVPVNVSAVLGRAKLEVGELLRLGPGTVLELDRRVGEAIDIFVNDRLVARGEVVLVEDRLGVTMTEIIKADR